MSTEASWFLFGMMYGANLAILAVNIAVAWRYWPRRRRASK